MIVQLMLAILAGYGWYAIENTFISIICGILAILLFIPFLLFVLAMIFGLFSMLIEKIKYRK